MKKIVGLFILIFSTNIFAQSASESLAQLLNPIQTLSANFEQVLVDPAGKVLQKAEGKMLLSRPGKFRWEVTAPNSQLIIANGKKLWVYDPDLEQVTIRSLNQGAGETPALLLTRSHMALEKEFKVRMLNHSSMQWFILTPKSNGNIFRTIKLGFVKSTIKQMQLIDHLDQTTIINFSEVKTNPLLEPKLFYFTPPAQVDVINETSR